MQSMLAVIMLFMMYLRCVVTHIEGATAATAQLASSKPKANSILYNLTALNIIIITAAA